MTFLTRFPSAVPLFLSTAALGVALAAGPAACGGDSCTLGESRCYEHETRVCSGPNDTEYGNHFNTLGIDCKSAPCRDVMENGLRTAVCSTSGVKDPRCDGAGDYRSICVSGTTQLYCNHGYSAFEKPCAATCVVSVISGTFCALSGPKDPACAGGSGPWCDGNSVVTCREGYVTARSTCASSCAQVPDEFHSSFCLTSATCTGPNDVVCDGTGAMKGCFGGAVVAMTCDAGTVCKQYGTPAGGHDAECIVP